MTGDVEELIGFARLVDNKFIFFDLDERELTEVDATAMLGKSASAGAGVASRADEDDEPAGSGCCSPARSRSGSVAQKKPGSDGGWFVKAAAGSEEFGPISLDDMKVLWRYHLIPEDAQVRQTGGEPTSIKEQPEHFSPAQQIHVLDPTSLDRPEE